MYKSIFKNGLQAITFCTTSLLGTLNVHASSQDEVEKYQMKTATFDGKDINFENPQDLEEVIKVGFFRIKRPENVDINVTREFARTFNQDPKYTNFGSTDPVNGYIQSELAQTIRFTLERDHWDKLGWGTELEDSNPNYSPAIQKVGNQMKDIGVAALMSILDRFGLPEEVRFQATAGAAYDEGSYYLNFNYYDPSNNPDKPGLGAHRDWGWLTVLDATEEGLEAEIDGRWMPLVLEEGYFTINFGEPLKKLLPMVNACNHRVITQTAKPRISTIMFIDPRVGPYRPSANQGDGAEGIVYEWDNAHKTLVNGESTIQFFGRLSQELYGKLNENQAQ